MFSKSFIKKNVEIPPQIVLINRFNCSTYGKENINKDTKHPTQKDEHSIHNNIFRKNCGKCFATKFLAGIKISDFDHKKLQPKLIIK